MKKYENQLILKASVILLTIFALYLYAEDFMEVMRYVFG